jgi:hypothetical protein
MNPKTPAAFMASALILSGCQTVTENEPPRTEVARAPVLVPVILNPLMIPLPSEATPQPTPTPTPAAPEPPKAKGCGVEPGTGNGQGCSRQSPSFLQQVESAMDQLVREEPSLFDQRKTRGCGNCYLVLDPTRYAARMAELMAERSLCGHYDGEELAVKESNAFNDQYDILTSDMFIRRQLGAYRSTCYPAWF